MGYYDVATPGKSKVVPYREGESSPNRHKRRLNEACKALGDVVVKCKQFGIAVDTFNNLQHWRFTSSHVYAEWWPSSAKLVFNRDYKRGVHCHDWEQVIAELMKVLDL